MLRMVRAAALAAAVFPVIAASAAQATTLVYEIYDHYDFVAGDPFDKGFSVSGTITATGLGNFTENDDPFGSWNITEVVRKSGQPDETFIFTPGNSSWDLNQEGDLGLAVIQVTEDYIWLVDTYLDPGLPSPANELTLAKPSDDKQLTWTNPPAATLPWLFFSSTISNPPVFDGVHEGSGGGYVLIATRTTVVPLPASGFLLIGGIALATALRRRS